MLRIIKKPVIGINNGLILCCESICEKRFTGLGIINSDTMNNLSQNESSHELEIITDSSLITGIDPEAKFYFNNNYFVEINEFSTAAVLMNGIKISAITEKDNFYGVQFNPEYSGEIGAAVINNFLRVGNLPNNK